ncbi:hypothetical protein [Streptomyces sp. JHA19]|uniref:hypothetical protein n=1 Tax=Streptomyces sp. JHA19 TaxID=1577588 RepID=UPI00131DF37B|nr:hypothetical protein [Streptomyces sp. JHA19]
MASTYAVSLEPTTDATAETVEIAGSEATVNPRAHLVAILPDVVEVDYSEGAEILDRVARRKLGISGEEFVRRWDSGEYAGAEENVKAQEVADLLPFARPMQDNAR